MLRNLLVGTLAICGVAVGSASAEDPARNLGRYRPADDVATQTDTETVRGWRHHYRYPSFYYRGFGGGWGGYSNAFSYYYAPPAYYHVPRFYYPSVGFYSGSYYGFGGGFCGISGSAESSGVTQTLAWKPSERSVDDTITRLPSPMAPQRPDTFRYDGGPSSPIPLPRPDSVQPQQPDRIAPVAPRPADETMLIRYRPKPAAETKPITRYKAYGEK